jgi:hypothetical protein
LFFCCVKANIFFLSFHFYISLFFVSFSYFRHFCYTIMHFFIPHFLFNLLFSVLLTSTVSLLSFKQSPSEILSLSLFVYIFFVISFPCNLSFSNCSIYYI